MQVSDALRVQRLERFATLILCCERIRLRVSKTAQAELEEHKRPSLLVGVLEHNACVHIVGQLPWRCEEKSEHSEGIRILRQYHSPML